MATQIILGRELGGDLYRQCQQQHTIEQLAARGFERLVNDLAEEAA